MTRLAATSPGEPEPDALPAWRNLLRVSARVLQELDRRLDLEHRISIREFDVLINLEHPQRMTELANASMLSSGGLTRLVGRLEARGLIQRDQDPEDARAFHASLTDAGRIMLAESRATHDAVIRDLFGTHLTAAEVETMARTLARVLGPRERG